MYSSGLYTVGDIHGIEDGGVFFSLLFEIVLVDFLQVDVQVIFFELHQVPLVYEGINIILDTLIDVIKIIVSQKATLLDMFLLTNY